MSQPEKDRKNDAKRENQDKDGRPQWETILPSNKTASPGELFAFIDDYQRKIEKQWEDTKEVYQQKINELMEEFVKEKQIAAHSDSDTQPTKNNPFTPKDANSEINPADFDPATTADRLENLLSRVERSLRSSDSRSRELRDDSPFLPWKPRRERIINISRKSLAERWRPATLIVALVALATFSIYKALGAFQIGRITPLPYTHTTGLILSDRKIYIADWFRKALYVHEAKRGLPILSIENIQNEFITGLALSEKNLWTLDGLRREMAQHSLTKEHSIIRSVPSPGKAPVGLFWDGTDLWSADKETKTLYRHIGNDLEDIVDQYALPVNSLASFQIVKNRLWVLDGKSREMSVYRLQNPLKELALFDLDAFLEGAVPTGFAIEEKTLWILTENPARLMKLPRRELEKKRSDPF